MTSKWCQSDVKVSYDIRKSSGQILHSIRPDKRKTDPKRTPNGPKMYPKCTQNASKSATNRPDPKRNLLSIRIDMQRMERLGRNWYLIRATDRMSRRTNQMDWQIDRKWSCTAVGPAEWRIRATRKSFSKMCLIWLWADLGAIWGRSEANLHSIRPDNRKMDPKRSQNGPKIYQIAF